MGEFKGKKKIQCERKQMGLVLFFMLLMFDTCTFKLHYGQIQEHKWALSVPLFFWKG